MKLFFRATVVFLFAAFSLTMSAQNLPEKEERISKAKIGDKPPTVVSPRFNDSTLLELKESKDKPTIDTIGQKPTPIVREMPSFPGGEKEMYEFIAKNLKYPIASRKAGLQGRVIMRFIIEADGTISDATVIRGIDPECDKEAKRVINAMPKWTPSKEKWSECARILYLTHWI